MFVSELFVERPRVWCFETATLVMLKCRCDIFSGEVHYHVCDADVRDVSNFGGPKFAMSAKAVPADKNTVQQMTWLRYAHRVFLYPRPGVAGMRNQLSLATACVAMTATGLLHTPLSRRSVL